jgi:TolA-binding protein
MKIALLIAWLAAAALAQNRIQDDLRKGVVAEETGRDLAAAIQHYQAVVTQFDEERKAAANALFQMAEQYRKQGRNDQATAAYARVVEEFAGQGDLVKQSRARLPASFQPQPPPGAMAVDAQAQARVDLLDQLKLQVDYARKDYDAQFHRFQLGMNEQHDLINASGSVAKAERDLVGYEIWLAESPAARPRKPQQERRREEPRKAATPAYGQKADPAMVGYQSALDRYSADRETAAAALFRLAECYRKQGKSPEATSAYARIVGEFPDRTRLANESRPHLPEYAKPAAPDLAALRKQYRATLEKDVEIAQSNSDYIRNQVQLGAYSPLEMFAPQRNLAEAKGRLAAWDAGVLKPEPPFSMRK